MYVVEVIPITRGVFKDTLTFFSKHKLDAGVVVDAPLRGKKIPALVVESRDARESKAHLRGSDFALKKLSPRTTHRLFPSSTLSALRAIAEHHATPLSSVLAHFTPRAIVDSVERVAHAQEEGERKDTASDILAFQADYEERVRMYRAIARESFARGDSVMIITPTIMEAETLHQKLFRGIEEQVVLLTSNTAKKASVSAWNRIVEDPEPLLIITTGSFLMVPRPTITTYIVEHENARWYTRYERPHIDLRISAELLAKKQGSRLIIADFPLRIETRARLEAGAIEEFNRLQVSAQQKTQVRVVDMRIKKDPVDVRDLTRRAKKFSVFSETTLQLIKDELASGGRIMLYTQRKGLAPLTVCNDCGTPVTDPASGTPMTLHKTEAGNVFVSFYSGRVVSANTSCTSCGSWNLISLGVGVERVIEEASKHFPDTPLFSITADTTATHAKAKKTSTQFYSSGKAILVGTDRALPYLFEPVELSVVVSIDSLLSISAWRAHEYALQTLFYLRDRTERAMVVQTRQEEHEVMRAIASGNPTDFIRGEFKDRKQFGYPPFATFIGLSWSGTEKSIARITELIREQLTSFELVGPLPARYVGKNRYHAHAVIRFPQGGWPHQTLSERLKMLPPEVAISIDPDEIV